MSRLIDCMEEIIVEDVQVEKEELIELKKLKDFVEQGLSIFGKDFLEQSKMIKEIQRKEKYYLSNYWEEKDAIPEEYKNSVIPEYSYNGSYRYNMSLYGRLSKYPLTSLNNIVKAADALNMVILSLDYIDLEEISRQYDLYHNSYYREKCELIEAIDDCKELLKEENRKYYMYILCPLAYYDVWKEIHSKNHVEKYYPETLESIFTVIDMIIPAQKNLLRMCENNESNTKLLSNDLEKNMEIINSKLKRIETRIFNIENQVKIIQEKQQEAKDELKRVKFKKKELEKMVYSLLDPLIFFVYDDPIDFAKKENRTTHMVACFGPEFPEEIFVMNGLSVIKRSPKKFEEILF